MKRTVLLIILDGWGIGRNNQGNPLYIRKPKLLNFLPSYYLTGSLQASGVAVGLPWSEESNSEVGHLILGAGRIVYQHYLRIKNAIDNGEFFKNPALLGALHHAKQNNSTLHFIGLLTESTVHAAIDHLEALTLFARKNKVRFALQLFTDGQDSDPKSAPGLLKKLGDIPLASLGGRFYGMDRDNHWERIEKAYQTLIGAGREISGDPITEIERQYKKDLTDQYLDPFIVQDKKNPIGTNDSVFFFNFREDRMRQLVESFIDPRFDKFPRPPLKNVYYATMTPYSDNFDVAVAFPPEGIPNCLARVLADNGKTQLHIAETEKYAHVTYFFNAYQEKPFENEFRVLIPSLSAARHDEHPEMMAHEVTARIIEAIEENTYDFIVANIANFDMIAHTGNFEAALQTIDIIDAQIEKIWKAVIDHNAILVMTSDHGNIEKMLDMNTWLPQTKHDANPVPIHIIGNGFESIHKNKLVENIGILADVAPTILGLLGLPPPEEMSGQNLLPLLK
jgi:2,3-bisphosphoglycerate-independent phosphoglycerate mutase